MLEKTITLTDSFCMWMSSYISARTHNKTRECCFLPYADLSFSWYQHYLYLQTKVNEKKKCSEDLSVIWHTCSSRLHPVTFASPPKVDTYTCLGVRLSALCAWLGCQVSQTDDSWSKRSFNKTTRGCSAFLPAAACMLHRRKERYAPAG